jgi:hypothetical protein
MRSETEIRREIEARLRRRGFLLLHGALWAIITFSLYAYSRYQGVPVGWTTSAVFFMGLWAFIVGLHTFWVGYVELRDRLVRQAVERERRYYPMGDAYAKPKRREAPPRLSDDGDLVDFPDAEDRRISDDDMDDAKVKYGR